MDLIGQMLIAYAPGYTLVSDVPVVHVIYTNSRWRRIILYARVYNFYFFTIISSHSWTG